MTILLLRHADAGVRGIWHGADRDRPLSDRGWIQASQVVEQYAGHPVSRILSSPLRRCMQTVEPLGAARDLPIEEEEAIAEGVTLDVVQGLLGRLGGQYAVLCTHGDVIERMMTDLHHRDVTIHDDLTWKKASTWVLEGAPAITTAALLPPPASTT